MRPVRWAAGYPGPAPDIPELGAFATYGCGGCGVAPGIDSRRLLLLLALGAISACGLSEGERATGPTTTPDRVPPPTSIVTAPPPASTTSTPPPTTTTTAAPASPPPQPPVLGIGARGPEVASVEQRLVELRYWLGEPDGTFDGLTQQAVYAFQKANDIAVDGRVGPQTRSELASSVELTPQSSAGRVIEVDKAKQLLYAVLDGQVQWVFHTSTGTERPYRHPSGHRAVADTPGGRHQVIWQVDGWRDGRLGPMYRPKYFHRDGIAVHGYGSVPPYPASHGCVRVSFAAMDFIWREDLMPLRGVVLVYGSTPVPS